VQRDQLAMDRFGQRIEGQSLAGQPQRGIVLAQRPMMRHQPQYREELHLSQALALNQRPFVIQVRQ
jgi:hypothetical protein